MIRNTRGAFAALALVPTLALVAGCAKKTVVGKWSGTQNGMAVTMEFKEGGLMTQDATTQFGAVQATGSWKVEGENLTIGVTDVKMAGKSVMAMLPAQFKNQLNQTATFKFEKDNLVLTQKGQSATFTPVK